MEPTENWDGTDVCRLCREKDPTVEPRVDPYSLEMTGNDELIPLCDECEISLALAI